MVSSTQQFERIRKRKATKNGKWNKRTRRRIGTPAFSVHPEGYDPYRTTLDDWKEPATPIQRVAQRMFLAGLVVGATVGTLFATGVLR